MDGKERFAELVKDLGARLDQSLSVGDRLSASLRFGEQNDLGHLQYLERSESVVIWATVGFLPPDGLAPMRAVRVLQMLDLTPEMQGFTFGVESGTGRLVAAARRSIDELDDATELVGMIDGLAVAVSSVRTELAESFPVEFEDFDINDVDLGDEGEDPVEVEEEA